MASLSEHIINAATTECWNSKNIMYKLILFMIYENNLNLVFSIFFNFKNLFGIQIITFWVGEESL